MSSTRPATSKARGICKYYNGPNGCLAGRTCKFLHGEAEKLTPYDKAKTCRFYAAGFCKRGDDCWFNHAQPPLQLGPTREVPGEGVMAEAEAEAEAEEDGNICCICYEKPGTYGLLSGCSHVFCMRCIKEWRNPQGKSEDVIGSGMTKTCPLCRTSSQFVTPSSYFYPQDHPSKAEVIRKYKESMARIPCRYFQKSSARSRYCPFGKDCFYQHLNSDGTQFMFKKGVEDSIKSKRYRMLQREIRMEDSSFVPGPFTDLDAVIAGLRSLAISVSEAAARGPHPDDSPWADYDAEDWAPGGVYGFDPVLNRLAENIISSLVTFGQEDASASVTQSRHTAPQGLNVSIGPGAETTQLQAAPGDPEPASAPPEDIHLNFSIDRSSQSTPIDHSDPEPPVVRPSCAPASAHSRFSTTVPGRLSDFSTAGDSERDIPESISGSVLSTASCIFGDIAIEPPTQNHESLSAARDDAFHSNHSCHCSGPSAVMAPPDDVSGNTTSNQQCSHRTAAVVHDTDPPFMTDGRGRVVWSSATAAARSRRSRAVTASATMLEASQARDRPRGGDPLLSERCPLETASHRPVSLSTEGGANLEMRPSI